MTKELTWEKPGQDVGRMRRGLMTALSRSGVCVMLENSASDYLFIANFLDRWELDPGDAPNDTALFGRSIGSQLAALKQMVRESGNAGEAEMRLGTDRYFRFVVDPVAAEDGSTDLVTTIIEVSEGRRGETLRRTLLREVSHRSKNLLAIIQSIASQTARHSGTIEQFLGKFRGRLYSLSLSQDLVTESLWRGAYLQDLVKEQLQRYVPERANAVAFTGDNVLLNPNAALHIGLALHELVVNAMTHGSLGTSEASVTIACHKKDIDDKTYIEFEWCEDLVSKGNDAPAPVPEQRFGSAMLERVLPASVNGEADYRIGRNRLTYRLTFPADVTPP